MRIAWATDIHWDRLDETERMEFKESVKESSADALIITGDIGEAPVVVDYLSDLNDDLAMPIYFVLGNHDFWRGSFDGVRAAIQQLTGECKNLHWMSKEDVIRLTPSTAIIGHEGWGDGRVGNLDNLTVWPRDFIFISDLAELTKEMRLQKLNALGDEAAEQIRMKLIKAANTYSQIYLITHVPPFRETCIDSYRICDEQKLPFYCCKAIGDVLLEVMKQNPKCNLTVLCGHSHFECDLQVLDNLRVMVGEAGYGCWYPPKIIEVS